MPERLVLLFPLLCLPAAYGEDQERNLPEQPSMDFIEFLGEWQTGEGEWIGPDVLEGSEFARLDRLRQTEQEDEEHAD